MVNGLEKTWIEWRTVEARDFDGWLDRVEATPEGRVLIVERARQRNWVDGTDLQGGAHETVALKGIRRVRLDYVVEVGPCSIPRDS